MSNRTDGWVRKTYVETWGSSTVLAGGEVSLRGAFAGGGEVAPGILEPDLRGRVLPKERSVPDVAPHDE